MPRPHRSSRIAGPLVASVTLLAIATACGGGGGGSGGPTGPTPPVVASVSVSPGKDTLTALGQTRQLTAVAKDAAGAVISGKTFAWSSSSSGIVAVDPSTGLATAAGNGEATLTATVDGRSGQAVVLVDQQVTTVEISPTAPAPLTAIGANQQFTATAKDGSGAVIAGMTFLWLSSNQAVATIDATGKATAIAPGITTITAAARGVPASATLTVTQTALNLLFSTQPVDLVETQPMPGAVQVEIRDGNGALVTGARTTITLSLSNSTNGAILGGAVTVSAVGGIATFSNLMVDRPSFGQQFKLLASAAGFTSIQSNGFSSFINFRYVGVGDVHTCATAYSGALFCWGSNVNSQLGDGTTIDHIVPQRAFTPPQAYMYVPAPGNPFADCALAVGGAAWCWGTGPIGQPTAGFSNVPLIVAVPTGVTFLTLDDGAGSACGSTPFGTVYCWGTNANHQIGDGTTTTRKTPVPVVAPANVFFVQVAVGGFTNCALASGGNAYCWGANDVGQVGDGTLTEANVPTAVSMPAGVKFSAVDHGGRNGCGVATTGVVYCWGRNVNGALGDGTTTDHPVPTSVSMPAGVFFTQVTLGQFFSCALSSTGVVYCWGVNAVGVLGDGTLANHFTPMPVTMPPGVTFTQVAADASGGACAVATTGQIYCWGGNSAGQVGDGTTIDRSVPTRVIR